MAPKFTMSSAPTDTTCGIPARPAAAEPIRPGAQDAADDLVAPLGGRHVHDAGEIAVVDQSLHGATTGARRVEHEHVEPGALQALRARR